MIGATTSQSLDLTLINKGDIVYGTSTIKVEIGLKIGSTVEYIPIGIYNIDDIEKTDYTIKITAFDNMMKFERNFSTTLGDTLTLQQVVSELNRITGVEFTGTLPSYNVKKLEGFSCREILSYVASICGGNAIITRNGKFTIVTPKDINYSIGTSNYFDYKREETKYKIGKISCQAGEEVLTKGNLGADSMELEFENPWITTAILNDIYTKLNGFEYLGYSMKWQGDLSLDVGDIVTITDKKGVVRKHPILSQKFTYTGGLTSEIFAKGENKNKNSYSSSGPSAKKVERVVMELALINKALIDVAYIGDLTAGNIKFDTASGNIMDLQTLLAKFITGENGQFLNLTTDNVVIANAVIKDAMIDSLSLNKLKAGTIDTNKINLASADGGLSIVGPTMQFKDSSNRIRLQLGQDATGDFNFILRAADGTTTLIDGYGIKEKAIADDLIKENMIAENAIGEKQINYSSLVTGLNKDTNTSLIQASKVAIDLTGQKLDVAFNSLKTNVDGINSTVKSNTTSITVAQEKIEGLIKESSITKSDVTTLKDNYTSIKATVDGINTTVASHTSSIGALNSNVSTIQSSISQLDNQIKLKVEATDVIESINSIQIGARNLLRNSNFSLDSMYWSNWGSPSIREFVTIGSKKWCHIKGTGTAKYEGISQNTGIQIEKETQYTFSVRVKGASEGQVFTVGIHWNNSNNLIEEQSWNDFTVSTTEQIVSFIVTSSSSDVSRFNIMLGVNNDSIVYDVYFTDAKLEKGNKQTDWTPAPEDVDNSIDSVESRVNIVEQNITATALTTTISSAINAGTSNITTTQFVMDKTGLTIKNGAIKIQNKAGNTVLTGDTDGNLYVQNNLIVGGNTNGNIQVKNASNINIFSVSKNGILLKDGTMKVTTGAINWGSVGDYPDGETKDMIVYANGLSIDRVTYSGSQKLIFNARYYDDLIKLIEDNRENADGKYLETIINARGITTKDIFLAGYSRVTNGYTKLPNGLILQWGEFAITDMTNNSARYINFPIIFPNRCFSVVGNLSTHDGNTNPRSIPYLLWNNNETNFYLRIMKIGLPYENTIATARCSWMAIGY